MAYCPECGRIYDESEYTSCPNCRRSPKSWENEEWERRIEEVRKARTKENGKNKKK